MLSLYASVDRVGIGGGRRKQAHGTFSRRTAWDRQHDRNEEDFAGGEEDGQGWHSVCAAFMILWQSLCVALALAWCPRRAATSSCADRRWALGTGAAVASADAAAGGKRQPAASLLGARHGAAEAAEAAGATREAAAEAGVTATEQAAPGARAHFAARLDDGDDTSSQDASGGDIDFDPVSCWLDGTVTIAGERANALRATGPARRPPLPEPPPPPAARRRRWQRSGTRRLLQSAPQALISPSPRTAPLAPTAPAPPRTVTATGTAAAAALESAGLFARGRTDAARPQLGAIDRCEATVHSATQAPISSPLRTAPSPPRASALPRTGAAADAAAAAAAPLEAAGEPARGRSHTARPQVGAIVRCEATFLTEYVLEEADGDGATPGRKAASVPASARECIGWQREGECATRHDDDRHARTRLSIFDGVFPAAELRVKPMARPRKVRIAAAAATRATCYKNGHQRRWRNMLERRERGKAARDEDAAADSALCHFERDLRTLLEETRSKAAGITESAAAPALGDWDRQLLSDALADPIETVAPPPRVKGARRLMQGAIEAMRIGAQRAARAAASLERSLGQEETIGTAPNAGPAACAPVVGKREEAPGATSVARGFSQSSRRDVARALSELDACVSAVGGAARSATGRGGGASCGEEDSILEACRAVMAADALGTEGRPALPQKRGAGPVAEASSAPLRKAENSIGRASVAVAKLEAAIAAMQGPAAAWADVARGGCLTLSEGRAGNYELLPQGDVVGEGQKIVDIHRQVFLEFVTMTLRLTSCLRTGESIVPLIVVASLTPSSMPTDPIGVIRSILERTPRPRVEAIHVCLCDIARDIGVAPEDAHGGGTAELADACATNLLWITDAGEDTEELDVAGQSGDDATRIKPESQKLADWGDDSGDDDGDADDSAPTPGEDDDDGHDGGAGEQGDGGGADADDGDADGDFHGGSSIGGLRGGCGRGCSIGGPSVGSRGGGGSAAVAACSGGDKHGGGGVGGLRGGGSGCSHGGQSNGTCGGAGGAAAGGSGSGSGSSIREKTGAPKAVRSCRVDSGFDPVSLAKGKGGGGGLFLSALWVGARVGLGRRDGTSAVRAPGRSRT